MPNTTSVKNELLCDLQEFEFYANFDYRDVKAWKTREKIVEKIHQKSDTAREVQQDVVYNSVVKQIKREGAELKPTTTLKIQKQGHELVEAHKTYLQTLSQYFGLIPGYSPPAPVDEEQESFHYKKPAI